MANIQRGFTLIELIITLFIVGSLLTFITINLSSVQQTSSLSTSVDTLIADMKEQQTKAMVGATEGRSNHDNYGVYFQTNSYTFFHGNTYSSSDPSNFVLTLGNTKQFLNVPFTVLYASVSGEVVNYSTSANTVTIQDTTTGQQKVIQFNRYGVITGVN